MAAFSARFRRGGQEPAAAVRVGEILSDSSDGSERAEVEAKEEAPAAARRSRQAKRSGSRKWYSDSDSGEEGDAATGSLKRLEVVGGGAEQEESTEVKASEDGAEQPKEEKQEEATRVEGKDRPRLKRLTDVADERKDSDAVDSGGEQVLSPLSDSDMPLPAPPQLPGKKQTSFQKLMAKTKTLSPFAARSKALDAASAPTTPAGIGSRSSSMASEILNEKRPSSASVSENAPEPTISNRAPSSGPERSISQRRGSKLQVTTTDLEKPTAVESGVTSSDGPPISRKSSISESGGQNSMPIINRRMSRLKQSPHSDYSGGGNGTPRNEAAQPVVPMQVPVQRTFSYETPDSMSPGQRKQPGVFPGHPGSGVILEGWLRQKQRRGMKGMKKWNSRYFVLYAKTNEIRYYADVVPSAWGPIPLGEIGSISLRLIQRIGKPSHPKYKGCRFDITCRNTWGTHYADDYVSSEDENNIDESNTNSNNSNTNNAANTANGKSEKSSTPKSSRVYSLIADSPQVTVTWVNVLDSMLVRSANSPRPDVNSPGVAGNNKMKKIPPAKAISRRRSSALDMETVILCGEGESIPHAVSRSIYYIFNSSPGVETPHFYELEVDAAKLKAAIKFLNQSMERESGPPAQTPSKEELAELSKVLDPVTAGGVVKAWLRQIEQPLIPFEMYTDFKMVAVDAAVETFDLSRNLKALLGALPAKNRSMLGCLLYHLNDINAYASANEMDAALLAKLFADYFLRPRTEEPESESAHADIEKLVAEMIVHVDSYIDESEIEGQA